MNPLLLEFLSSVARWGLAAAAGILVKHGVIEGTAAARYIDAASSWIVIAGLGAAPLVWAFFKAKTRERMIKLAIAAPPDTTPAEIRELSK